MHRRPARPPFVGALVGEQHGEQLSVKGAERATDAGDAAVVAEEVAEEERGGEGGGGRAAVCGREHRGQLLDCCALGRQAERRAERAHKVAHRE